MTTDRDAFERHLENASRVVATWPRWKQTILGGNPIMTPTDQIKHARALLAGIKAEIERGTGGKWYTDGELVCFEIPIRAIQGDDPYRVCDCRPTVHQSLYPSWEEAETNARNIAAEHNAMPTALEDIEADLRLAEDLIEDTYSAIGDGIITRKLALLETLARDFGVEVEP